MSKAMDMEYKASLKENSFLPKNTNIQNRKIKFILGNTFDVFLKDKRLTSEQVVLYALHDFVETTVPKILNGASFLNKLLDPIIGRFTRLMKDIL